MAQPTKSATSLQASTSQAASGSTTGTSVNLTQKFTCLATGIITNGAVGPTLPCDFIVEVSRNNSNWHEFSRQTANNTALAVNVFHVIIPIPVMYVRSRFTGNTGQAVTIEAYLQQTLST